MTKRVLAAVAAVGVFTVGATATLAEVMNADDVTKTSISRDAFATASSTRFEQVDVNDDQRIDLDEYAAFSIVSAELARLNRGVVIEAPEPVAAALPAQTPKTVSPAEFSAIDAIARRRFYSASPDGSPLSEQTWTTLLMTDFSRADRNANDVLSADELTVYARGQAADRISA